jgi:hypothetical protein
MALTLKELATTGKFTYHAIAALVFLFMAHHIKAQDLNHNKWEHRIILIVSNDPDTSQVQEQLIAFTNQSKDLLDRKLLVYLVTAEKTILLDEFLEEKLAVNSSDLWDKYHSTNHPFKICLIGLDGGTKFTAHTVVKSQEIFDRIDTMPMRRNELKGN